MERFDAEVTIRRTRFASEETGWAVVEAAADDGEEVVLVGPLTHLEERERARVIGTWVDDSRYGLQISVAEARPLPPSDAATLVAYLRRIKHVGLRRATQLVDRYGTNGTLEAIDRDPQTAFAGVGLRRARVQEAAAAWHAMRVTRQLHMLLAPHGLGYLVKRVHGEYGSSAHRVVTERPYELTSVFGVGFTIADRIARTVALPSDGRARARAGLLHLLAEAERSGSTCLPPGELMAALGELLRAEPPSGLIDELAGDGDIVNADGWIYRAATAALEAELAERVRTLVGGRSEGRLQVPTDGPSSNRDAHELTQEQQTGLANALTYRLSVITGGPGTGKTASIRSIASAASAQGARVMLLAPTGRAAIRMTEASGLRARTVHSGLGWIPGSGPSHDEDDPLPCELLIVDESSMANLELMVTLLRAVGAKTHVVLVGDADQLAPVGAGKPFAELVASDIVPTVRLSHIFRQAAGSMIVQAAHAIRRGEVPEFIPREGMRRDLFLISRADPHQALEEVVSLVSRRLPDHYGVDPVSDIQVFAPVYRGKLGIDALNEALREALNPAGEPVRGDRLRIGDKVMLTGRNLHELGLMNGTLLRLLDEISGSGDDDDAALLLGSEETVFRLPPEESPRLRLAYACSVHRGQGIELPVAVIVAHQAAGAFFLRREMLYTAVTRAQLATVVVGTPDVLARAARTPDTGRRHSRLAARLEQPA
jgi:exodeoxyribonuclease V alpha subunit